MSKSNYKYQKYVQVSTKPYKEILNPFKSHNSSLFVTFKNKLISETEFVTEDDMILHICDSVLTKQHPLTYGERAQIIAQILKQKGTDDKFKFQLVQRLSQPITMQCILDLKVYQCEIQIIDLLKDLNNLTIVYDDEDQDEKEQRKLQNKLVELLTEQIKSKCQEIRKQQKQQNQTKQGEQKGPIQLKGDQTLIISQSNETNVILKEIHPNLPQIKPNLNQTQTQNNQQRETYFDEIMEVEESTKLTPQEVEELKFFKFPNEYVTAEKILTNDNLNTHPNEVSVLNHIFQKFYQVLISSLYETRDLPNQEYITDIVLQGKKYSALSGRGFSKQESKTLCAENTLRYLFPIIHSFWRESRGLAPSLQINDFQQGNYDIVQEQQPINAISNIQQKKPMFWKESDFAGAEDQELQTQDPPEDVKQLGMEEMRSQFQKMFPEEFKFEGNEHFFRFNQFFSPPEKTQRTSITPPLNKFNQFFLPNKQSQTDSPSNSIPKLTTPSITFSQQQQSMPQIFESQKIDPQSLIVNRGIINSKNKEIKPEENSQTFNSFFAPVQIKKQQILDQEDCQQVEFFELLDQIKADLDFKNFFLEFELDLNVFLKYELELEQKHGTRIKFRTHEKAEKIMALIEMVFRTQFKEFTLIIEDKISNKRQKNIKLAFEIPGQKAPIVSEGIADQDKPLLAQYYATISFLQLFHNKFLPRKPKNCLSILHFLQAQIHNSKYAQLQKSHEVPASKKQR